jgi:penicillin-binding protein 1C
VWILLFFLGVTPLAAADFPTTRASYCPSDARLLDRHGDVVHERRIDRTRRRLAWTALDEVSPALVEALLASEDRRFFEHSGVDWRAVGAAAWQRLRGGAPRGASTISMQLAALLDPELGRRGAPRTAGDKWAQMRAAWELEASWSKREILEAYLNLVTFRGELQGIGAASAQLFGKAPHGLTRAESAVLAALVRSPNADRDALARRADALLAAIDTTPGANPNLRTSAPSHLRMQLSNLMPLSAAIDRVVDTPAGGVARVALAPHVARRLMPDGGGCGDTRSTLDRGVQTAAVEAVQHHLLGLRDRAVHDAAVLVVDNDSGAVVAYVGSSGALSPARQVDGVQARRQAGSTLKPFLYGLALDRRLLTAAALLDDAPLELPVGSGLFRPRNYDDRFRGPISVRTALAGSLNVPAVRTLTLVGAADFAAALRDLGFAGVRQPGDYYGPSLALGSADVTLWEMVGAYRALANGGTWSPLTLVARASVPAESVARSSSSATQLDDPHRLGGDEHRLVRASAAVSPTSFTGLEPRATRLEHRATSSAGTEARATSPSDARDTSPSESRSALSPAAAFIVADILADRGSRGVTFGLESPLATRFWTAVKTGTSTDMRDNWCVGFSRRYTVGVWVGNFSGAPMRDVSGISGAAPIWQEVMEYLHRDLASPAPTPPPGLVHAGVAFANAVEPARQDWFLAGTEPNGAPALRALLPRVADPVDGTSIAIDPDIPAGRQRVAFSADAANGLRWRLDGRDLGPVRGILLWAPIPGAHELALVDERDAVVDRSRFSVR